ncbi:MAG: winged helix-turn-helix domain-containing protein [Pseudomonadota bacterium]
MEAPPITRIAQAIGDPARAAMLVALMDGRALTATELANAAGITRQTASAHLGRLHDAGLLRRDRQGRHAYFALRSGAVAGLLEQMMGLVANEPGAAVWTGPRSPSLRAARVCYDHLAGERAVELFEAFRARGWIAVEDADETPPVHLTDAGHTALERLGLPLASVARRQRPLCRACLDWSARRHHLAGSVGHLVLEHVLRSGWANRATGSRAVHFSARGERAFSRAFLTG